MAPWIPSSALPAFTLLRPDLESAYFSDSDSDAGIDIELPDYLQDTILTTVYQKPIPTRIRMRRIGCCAKYWAWWLLLVSVSISIVVFCALGGWWSYTPRPPDVARWDEGGGDVS